MTKATPNVADKHTKDRLREFADREGIDRVESSRCDDARQRV